MTTIIYTLSSVIGFALFVRYVDSLYTLLSDIVAALCAMFTNKNDDEAGVKL